MSRPEAELVALALRAKDGDAAAAEELLRALKPLVNSIARRYYLTDGDADDVVQEGMIGLFGAIRSYDPTRNDAFTAFAALCIHRSIRSAIRAANRLKNRPLSEGVPFEEAEELTGGASAEDEFFRLERVEALAAARAKLSAEDNALLELYLDGESYDEMARRLGVTPKKIDNSLQRIKNTLRAEIV